MNATAFFLCETDHAAEPQAAAEGAPGSAGGVADSEATEGRGGGRAEATRQGSSGPGDPAGRASRGVRQAAHRKTSGEGEYSELSNTGPHWTTTSERFLCHCGFCCHPVTKEVMVFVVHKA